MDLVAARVLAKEGKERAAEADRLVAEHPDHAQALRRAFSEIEATERLLADGFSDPRDTTPSSFGDYTIEREIGRGGMGVVYAAEQRTLGRRVALKVLSVPILLQSRALERFARESRLLAQLEHNGIVRVIDAGSAEGSPFYTMEYVDGASLAAVIEAVRRCGLASATGATIAAAIVGAARDAGAPEASAPASTARAESSYVRRVAEIGVQVADALAFAHAAGVIHRDVKPSNILLRRDGTAVLTDFGIARLDRDPSLTSTGDFTGTPFYMSPEQARGARVDHRTDVYSLGATLYELLTLRRPFEGPDSTAVLAKIQREEPLDPRQRNRAVSAELAAIVLMALAKDPAQRYSGAGELSADLCAYLNGEPISAKPPTRAQRLWRWCRREPWQATALATAAIAAVVLVGLSLAFTKRLLAENTSTKAALVLAEENFARATQAVEAMLTRVGERDLADVPQMELVRRELLQRALAFYSDFATARAGDRRSQLQLAIARVRVAWIRALMGEDKVAIETALAAVAEFDALLEASPGDPTIVLERAEAELTLAAPRGRLGDNDGALEALTNALSMLEPLVTPPNLDHSRRRKIAFARYGIAAEQRYRDPALARATLERAVTELVPLRREVPDDTAVLMRLANARIMLSALANNAADGEAAETLLRQAELDLEDAPAKPELMRLGATVHQIRAGLYKDAGRLHEAVESADASVKAWRDLVAAFPHTPIMRNRLGQAWANLGNCLRYLDRLDEAVAAAREAVRVYEDLVASLPDPLEHREGLGRALVNLGSMLSYSDRPTWYDEAGGIMQRATEIAERLHREHPLQTEYARLLADCSNVRAFAASTAGRHSEALAHYERGAELFGEAVRLDPDSAFYQDGQANMLRGVAEERLALDDTEGTVDAVDSSLRILRAGLERNPRNPTRRRFTRESLGVRARVCARLGDHTAACASLTEMTNLADSQEDAFDAAVLASDCLESAAAPDREAVVATCLAALARAIERGFKDADALARDQRFASLQQHAGFKALLQRMSQ